MTRSSLKRSPATAPRRARRTPVQPHPQPPPGELVVTETDDPERERRVVQLLADLLAGRLG